MRLLRQFKSDANTNKNCVTGLAKRRRGCVFSARNTGPTVSSFIQDRNIDWFSSHVQPCRFFFLSQQNAAARIPELVGSSHCILRPFWTVFGLEKLITFNSSKNSSTCGFIEENKCELFGCLIDRLIALVTQGLIVCLIDWLICLRTSFLFYFRPDVLFITMFISLIFVFAEKV